MKEYLKNNARLTLSVPTVLCFIQFVMGLCGAVRTGVFDSGTVNQLLATADGFEAVVLFVILLVLRDKKQ